ncbi:hypothetical protein D3C81_1517120 [compost metagenome]
MSHDQLVLDQRIAIKQERIAGIGVNDELIYFAQTEIILKLHFVKGFAKAPVAKSGWHPVCAERVDDIGWADFISHRIIIKSESIGNLHDFTYGFLQLFHF